MFMNLQYVLRALYTMIFHLLIVLLNIFQTVQVLPNTFRRPEYEENRSFETMSVHEPLQLLVMRELLHSLFHSAQKLFKGSQLDAV